MIARVGDGARVGITGVGAHVPDRVVTSAELASRLGEPEEGIIALTGIRERRVVAPGEATSDLAVPAALGALERAGSDPASVDLVIVATASPDMLFPSTAALVAARIGAVDAAAYDLSAACTGFLYGLAQAHAAVATGMARRSLVVGAEALSRLTAWDDRETAILFGDGAGAVVVESVEEGGFLGFQLGCDGTRSDDLFVAAGGSRSPASEDTVRDGLHTIRMKGRDVFRFSTRTTVDATVSLLARCSLGVEDIDLYAPHQANKRIIDYVARRLDLSEERVLVNIDRFGNTSAASIPLALDDAIASERLSPGAVVLMTAVGAGLTWGAALIRWSGGRS